MFILRSKLDAMQAALNRAVQMQMEGYLNLGQALAEATRLKEENARLLATQEWMKLRLNHVERERGQLIQAAIGVKVAVPEFVPTYEDPGAALNDSPVMNTLGEDALDQFTPKTEDNGADYSNLPGYVRQK